MKILLALFFLPYVFSLSCPGSGQSPCNPGLPSIIQITPGTSISFPLSFSLNCIPTAFALEATVGLTITGDTNNCTITADAFFSGTGTITIEWCDISGNPGSQIVTCQAPTTTAPTTTTLAPTTTTTAAPTTTTTTAAPTTTTTTTAPTTTTTTAAPTTTTTTTTAPTTLAPTTTAPGCQGGPLSTCNIGLPSSTSMCSCEVKTFTFSFPSCIQSIHIAYQMDVGITATGVRTANSVSVTVQAVADTVGYAWIVLDWCDTSGGHGTSNNSIYVSPNVPTTAPTTTTTTTAPTTTTTTTTTTKAPTTKAPTTVAPTYPPTPTYGVSACRGKTPSKCTFQVPPVITMCSCEVKNFVLTMPSCGIQSYAFSYSMDIGLRALMIHNGTDYIEFSLSAVANLAGYANFTVEWCDNQNGYGHEKVSIYVSPSIPPATTPAPAAGSNAGCGPTGPASSCYAIGPNSLNFQAGITYNFSLQLSCSVGRILSDWAVSSGLCQVLTKYDGDLNPAYSITCASTITETVSGMIQTKWCDMKGGYLSYTTSFDVTPVVHIPTLPPPPSSGVDTCRHGPTSQCQVLGPSLVTVPAGESRQFSVTLQCPVKYCFSRWTATFHACAIHVTFVDVNPTYTINAPLGAENRGGMISTEWCDHYGGYMNWTTNFIVTGSTSNTSYQQAAEIGVLATGTNEAAADNVGGDWQHTPWVIFLFVLAGILVLIFAFAFTHLACKRLRVKRYSVDSSDISSSTARRSSTSAGGQPTGDFVSV